MPKENKKICPVCKEDFLKRDDLEHHIKEMHPHSAETQQDPDIKPDQRSERVVEKFDSWECEYK